jgi:hypothetical protein
MLVVLFYMMFRCFFRVLGGKQMMSMREMGVMARRFVVIRLMKLRRFPVMSGGVLVMFGRLLMMLRTFMFGHLR